MKRILGITGIALAFTGSALAGEYSTTENDRPLVLPQGMMEANAGLAAAGDFSAFGLAVGAEYGVAEDMALGVSWAGIGFGGGETMVMKMIGVGFGYNVMSDETMDLAAGAAVPLNFGEGDLVSGAGLSASFRYKVMDGDLAIRTGDGLIGIGLGDATTVTANVNLGATYQIAENMHVDVDTWLASIGLVGGGGTSTIGDSIPLGIGFGYNMDDMDIGVGINADATSFGDSLAIAGSFSYRM